ncbi:MAG: secretin and TonB N-terminal domain-containing protein [Deltaproteobacteria bacterium]|nr:secretin and TonB N-terminal domain-containing protein [Deltaproteobacteria bacterium]MDD3618570.1 secretin and TonB N-terminal domain-containing protein [Desulfobulbaceae bacterium]
MRQYSSNKRKPCFLKVNRLIAVSALFTLAAFAAFPAAAANMINSVTVNPQGSTHAINIHTSDEPAYTVYELFNPSRIVVDIADIAVADNDKLKLPGDLPYSLSTSTISDSDPALTRLEFTFDSEYTGYNVQTVTNQIVLTVDMGTTASVASQLPQIDISSGSRMESSKISSKDKSLNEDFGFGGYDKQRISVDFYKIDLHNVFRLFREISDVNIVVDESVKGSLTLALNDVPWDFALDIILNLKDLQKEERHNTIVILPNKKTFYWPDKSQQGVEVKFDAEILKESEIKIRQMETITPEEVEAKQLIQAGIDSEKNSNYEEAIKLYTEALLKWPNDKLANKIASVCLVYLRQNAQAAHFAKQALQINGQNANAALNAAIALANMHEFNEAQQYFDQSVSVSTPSREALLSYAVFSEEQARYEEAMKLLDKFESLYGRSVDSMIASARILDKQGNHEAATEKYKAILLSGYRIPPDLAKYIQNRIALNQ